MSASSATTTEMETSTNYQLPSYFCLLKHFDSIYASGLFCHIAKIGKKRDQQLRLIWAVEQMVEKVREVREENLQLRSPFFHARRYFHLSSTFAKRKCEADRFPPLIPQICETQDFLAVQSQTRRERTPPSRSPGTRNQIVQRSPKTIKTRKTPSLRPRPRQPYPSPSPALGESGVLLRWGTLGGDAKMAKTVPRIRMGPPTSRFTPTLGIR